MTPEEARNTIRNRITRAHELAPLDAALSILEVAAYNQGLEDAAKLAETIDVSFNEDATLRIAAAIREMRKP